MAYVTNSALCYGHMLWGGTQQTTAEVQYILLTAVRELPR